jgi:hypothetical protein
MASAQEFLKTMFEDNYCEKCGGDAGHHTVLGGLKGWIARCDYPPDACGRRHPLIRLFRLRERCVK